MSNVYDIIIIGAGPAGLSLAQCLRNTYKKILIIDKNEVIGGCHKVIRYKYKNSDNDVLELFTEHGPRIYSNSYKNFKMLLNDMNQDFYNLFVPYNFSIAEIGGETIFSTLSLSELLKITFQFVLLILNNDHGKDITLEEYMNSHNFGKNSIEIINRVARLTDGAGADRYTLNEFLQIFNQQFFYRLYQPNKPNDEGFLKIWQDFLIKNNIEFKLNTEISKLVLDNDKIKSVITNNGEILGNNFILAMPPESFVKILENSEEEIIKNNFINFDNLEKFAENTEYNEYICITFHWFKKIDLPKVYGFPRSLWGIAFIVLSDYMVFSNEKSPKTLISCAITIPDVVSPGIGLSANQCDESKEEILIKETLRQLRESYPSLPEPDVSIRYPGNYYNNNSQKWESKDEAFVTSSKEGFLPFKGIISNLYNLGTHNGKQNYKFTSLESAVTNGIYLSHILDKSLEKKYPIKDLFTFRDMILLIIYFIMLIICVFILCKLYIKKSIIKNK